MARKKSGGETEPPECEYEVHVIGTDNIRVDVYGLCIPRSTGEPVPGWGAGYLTNDQAVGLSKSLASAVARARPAAEKPKRGKK